MSKEQLLLVLGGTRIGDAFHAIPFLKKTSEAYHVSWLHGVYASSAIKFLREEVQDFEFENIPMVEKRPLPLDLSDVTDFFTYFALHKPFLDLSAYSKIVPFEMGTSQQTFEQLVCPTTVNEVFVCEDIEFNRKTDSLVHLIDPPEKGSHIVVQPTTVSHWKSSDPLYQLGTKDFEGLPIYNVGGKGERPLVGENITVANGASWRETAHLLVSCKFAVTLHSSVACLAYYLGVPFIYISFMPNLFPFHVWRDNITELLQPDLETLKRTIQDYIDHPREHTV